jgi:hypothetical protein
MSGFLVTQKIAFQVFCPAVPFVGPYTRDTEVRKWPHSRLLRRSLNLNMVLFLSYFFYWREGVGVGRREAVPEIKDLA